MLLSVVVPAHNSAQYLRAALDSLLADLPVDAEVLVVNDGSTDDTAEVLDTYRDRIVLVEVATPSGPGAARNRGATRASGRYIAFHDADDVVLPGRFGSLIEVLQTDPKVDLVFGNGIKIDAVGRPLGPVIPVRYTRRLKRRVGPAELLRGSFLYPQAFCMRRESYRELGGFASLRVVEDWEFALRASLSLRLRFIDRPLFAYRRYATSVTMREHDLGERMLEMLEGFVAAHPEIERLAGRRTVQHALARRLARCARSRARAGDRAGAAIALTRAISLAPASLRYRWRYLSLAVTARVAPGMT